VSIHTTLTVSICTENRSRSAGSMGVTAHPVYVIAQTSENGSIQRLHPTASETQRGAHGRLHTTLTISIHIGNQSRCARSMEVRTDPVQVIAQTLEYSSVQYLHPTASETQRGAHGRLHTTLTISIHIGN
jgi:hypothetical protein